MNTMSECFWFTGKPCSGKTTIAKGIFDKISSVAYRVGFLDGDVFRQDITSFLGFSVEDRRTNLLVAAGYIRSVLDQNNNVLACFVSPLEELRQEVKKIVKDIYFIHVDASRAECIVRDVKGMYKKAIAGEIKNFTGYNAPYEVPESPDLYINTEHENIEKSVEKAYTYIMGVLSAEK